MLGMGIAIGMITHIIADTFFWFRGIQFLWPLPINFNLWENFQINNNIHHFLLTLEFLFFRIYAWMLIHLATQNPVKSIWFVKYLHIWRRVEIYLFIIFLILTYLQIDWFFIIFSSFYIPSLIMALISTYLMREVFETDSITN